MASMGRNVQIRAPLKLNGFRLALELDSGTAFQDHDPFILGLVVPEPFGRGLPLGDDPLDMNAITTVNRRQ